MPSKCSLLVLLVGIVILLTACGGNADTTAPTNDGPQISLMTNPDPVQKGSVTLSATVKDTQGQPITDAQVFIFINHRDMAGMGNEYDGVMQEDGRYTATADLSMNGRWRITIQVKQPSQQTIEDFDLEVK